MKEKVATKGLQISKATHEKLMIVCANEGQRINWLADKLLGDVLEKIIKEKGY